MERLFYECQQGLRLKRFGKKWEVPPAYPVACQIMVDIAGHEDDSQIVPYTERAEGQLVAVHVRELVDT